jgi:hypothetical protein
MMQRRERSQEAGRRLKDNAFFRSRPFSEDREFIGLP